MKKRVILVGSRIDRETIKQSLGKPEYSYYFLLKEFLPALKRIAEVIEVKSEVEVEQLYQVYSQKKVQVYYLSFSPPHQTPVNLTCPTISAFAWEFDTLPDREWGNDPRHNWRYVFERIAGALVTSSEVSRKVKEMMGAEYRVDSFPAPVWDRFSRLFVLQTPANRPRPLYFEGTIIDSPALGLSADGLIQKPGETMASAPTIVPAKRWNLERVNRVAKRFIDLAWVSLCRKWVPQLNSSFLDKPALMLSGVVYTTVLNPADGRKNWVDIVTAFCWAFKHQPEATLVIKMTHNDLEYYRVVLLTLLSRLAPFQCRVVVLHGYLNDRQYAKLIKASDYYVNASSCEGLCLPLTEFLSAGKPVISPRHTAMKDYIHEGIAFVLRGTLEPSPWPHDPSQVLSAYRYRLNWESLVNSFENSFDVATKDPARYIKMAQAAHSEMKAFCSSDQVTKALDEFWKGMEKGEQPLDFAARMQESVS